MSTTPAALRRFPVAARLGRTTRDYALTFATEFAVMASMVLVYRLAARQWDALGFAEYSLVRRTVGFVQLPLLMGAGIAIPRYIAMRRDPDDPDAADTYFTAGLVLGLLPALVAGALLWIFAGPTAAVLFGSPAYTGLARALAVAVVGLSAHVLVYSYLRGHRRMKLANALQFLNLGLAPPFVFLVPGITVERVISYTGAVWALIATGAIVVNLARLGGRVWAAMPLRSSLRELFKFGVVRVPGEFAMTGLLALPAIIVTHFDGVSIGGFLAFAITILSVAGNVFAPLGVVLLPQASELVARQEIPRLRRILAKLVGTCVGLAAIFVVLFEVFGGWALRVYLGPTYVEPLRMARVVVLGVVPYVTFIVLRNALDALHVRPHNTINLLVALAAFVLVSGVGRDLTASMVGLVSGLTLLGLLTVRDAVRLTRPGALPVA